MDILDKIVVAKKKEVACKKSLQRIAELKSLACFERETISLSARIKAGNGIIAEFKRRSPSKQVINQRNSVIEVAQAYEKAGVSGISVLTDTQFFGGSLDDLLQARASVELPILRKDFMVDPFQIYEARAFGADVILLIASVLSPKEIFSMSRLAHELGLEVLLEIHNESELNQVDLTYVDLVGINNRNLKTFEVSLETSIRLSGLIPEEKIKVSESGISSIEAINKLKPFGFKGFLIGENFMRAEDPGREVKEFLNRLRR